jgi:hypothetical protein
VYLVNGEYVELSVVPASSQTKGVQHEFQAARVLGVLGGPLLCETRSIASAARERRGTEPDAPKTDKTNVPFVPTSIMRRGPPTERGRADRPPAKREPRASAPPAKPELPVLAGFVAVVRGKQAKRRPESEDDVRPPESVDI